MKKNHLFYSLIMAVVFLFGFAACATGTVYLKDASKYTSTPLNQNFYNNGFSITWGDYELKYIKDSQEKKIDFKSFGMENYKSKVGIVTDFKRAKKSLFDIQFVQGLNEINKESVLNDKTNSYIVIDNTKLSVSNSEKTVMIEDSSYIPVKVTRLNQFLREGKVYDMFANVSAGYKINIYGQDYAVIDVFAENPVILMNNRFNKELSTEETDFVSALILALYEFNQEYYFTN